MEDKEYLQEKTVTSQKVYSGNFLQAFCDTVTLPNNQQATREYIKHPGAACIIAITSNNEIILEYQYRYPIGEVILELPAGKLDPGELPLDCAKREFKEETGYIARNWLELGTCLPCIAYSTEKIIYFLATDLTKHEANPDNGEFIETIIMPLDNLFQLVHQGKIQDSKTLSGLMLYLTHKQKN